MLKSGPHTSACFYATTRLVALTLLALLASGCNSPSSVFDCGGAGQVRGGYNETNSGELIFKHGVVDGDAVSGYAVMFTDDSVLAEALRASPDPAGEAAHTAELLGELIVGYRFNPDGGYREHFTLGTSTSSGYSGGDKGKISVDAQGCARGDVKLEYEGSGFFALPMPKPAQSQTDADVESAPAKTHDDPLQRYAAVWARLNDRHPVTEFETLGYSRGVATVLSADPRAKKALQRIREQCPLPTTATLNEYAKVTGPGHPKPGIVLSGTVQTSDTNHGLVLDRCYIMQRNGEYIDQCFPLTTDCTTVPLYQTK